MSRTVCFWCKAPFVLKDDVLVCSNTDCPACDEKYLHEELIRTRKALEIAVDALKDYEDRDSYDCNGEYCGPRYSVAHDALEQITALTKGETDDEKRIL